MVTYSGRVDDDDAVDDAVLDDGAVFKALADPTRRALLDALQARDGQTLGALEAGQPMSRFGVMKHLRVLEDAGLVRVRRRGREKLHFLNPVPIRLVHDRWVSKYAEPWAATLSGLKHALEDDMVDETVDETVRDETVRDETVDAGQDEVRTVSWADGTAPVAEGTAVFEVFVKTTPERLWRAITDPAERAKYSFGVEVRSDWTEGSEYRGSVPGVVDITSGTNLTVDPPRLLVQTFDALWSDDVRAQGTTRVTWEIEPVGTSCRLTVTHDRLPAGANAELYGGWPMILSGLKTLLETGELLDTPGSLRFTG